MSRQQHIDSLEQQRVAMTRDVEKIAKDTRAARGELGNSAKRTATALRDDAKGAVRQFTDDARQVASEAGSETSEMAKERAKEGARKTAEAVDPRRYVRQQPVAGLLAGIGLGIAASFLFGSRTRRVTYSLAEDVS